MVVNGTPLLNRMQFLIELISLLIAFVTGWRTYRIMNPFFKWLYIQLNVWIVFWIFSWCLTIYQNVHDLNPNNSWVFNVYIFVELILLNIVADKFKSIRRLKPTKYILNIVFILIYFAQLLTLDNFNEFLNYACVIQNVTIILLFIPIVYLISNRSTNWTSLPEIWAIFGILIFSTGSIPFMSMLRYFNWNDPESSAFLFKIIIDILATVRYLLLSISFRLLYLNSKKNENRTTA